MSLKQPIILDKDETREFLRRLFCPTEEEAELHRAKLKELDETVTITPIESGFIAEVKGLNIKGITPRYKVQKYKSKITGEEVYAVFYNGFNFPTVQNWAARSSFAWPQWIHNYGTQRLELYEGALQEAMEIHVGEYVIQYDKIFSLLSDRAFEEVFELVEDDANG